MSVQSCQLPFLGKNWLWPWNYAFPHCVIGIYNFLPLVVFACLGNYLVRPMLLQIPIGQETAISFSQGGALDPMRCSIHLSSGNHVPKLDLCKPAKVPRDSCRGVGWVSGGRSPKAPQGSCSLGLWNKWGRHVCLDERGGTGHWTQHLRASLWAGQDSVQKRGSKLQ